MFRLLAFLLLVSLIALGFAWVADRPGAVFIQWPGVIDVGVPVLVAIIGIAILVLILLITWGFIRHILRSPQMIAGYFSARKRDKGYKALSQGMIAIGSGDSKTAQRCAHDAAKYLAHEPLTLLLQAQAAQINGKHDETRAHFQTMLEQPKTKLLGLHGLYMEAERAHENEASKHFAEQALKTAPDLPWANVAVFAQQLRMAQWEEARATLERQKAAHLLETKVYKRRKMILLTAQAREEEQKNPANALKLAQQALKITADFVPAVCLAARLLLAGNQQRKAASLLETAWKTQQHPDIAKLYIDKITPDKANDKIKRARKLHSLAPAENVEAQRVLAQTLITTRHFDEADTILQNLIKEQKASRTVFLMLADIAEQTNQPEGIKRDYCTRALRAPRDAAWIADGIISAHWMPVSPVNYRLDAFQWRIPEQDPESDKMIEHMFDLALIDHKTEPLKENTPPQEPATKPSAILPDVAAPKQADTVTPRQPDDPGLKSE